MENNINIKTWRQKSHSITTITKTIQLEQRAWQANYCTTQIDSKYKEKY